MLISPLAQKLCRKRGIDPAHLRGTGPRGRIMAADVAAGEAGKTPGDADGSRLADSALPPTRAPKDGYYVYDAEVDMQALAQMSFPIAVQCEKLLEKRYSLFDYIVRAVVKACTGAPEWEADSVDVLLFENEGADTAIIPDAADKTICTIARETSRPAPMPEEFRPRIVVCDAHTSRERVAQALGSPDHRPDFAFVARGSSPKVGIRAGRTELRSCILPYTFYASENAVSPDAANRIAAELYTLLYSPARLLLIA